MFLDDLDRKLYFFLDYKNNHLGKSQNFPFSKAVITIVLVNNLKLFHLFYLDKIGREQVFGEDIIKITVFKLQNCRFRKPQILVFL